MLVGTLQSPSHFLSNIMAMIKNLARPTMMVCSPLSVCSWCLIPARLRGAPLTLPHLHFHWIPPPSSKSNCFSFWARGSRSVTFDILSHSTHSRLSFSLAIPRIAAIFHLACFLPLPRTATTSPNPLGGWGAHPSPCNPLPQRCITTTCGRGREITAQSFRVPRTHIVTNHWGLLGRAVGLWDGVCRLTVPVYAVGVTVQARAMVQTRTMAEVC